MQISSKVMTRDVKLIESFLAVALFDETIAFQMAMPKLRIPVGITCCMIRAT